VLVLEALLDEDGAGPLATAELSLILLVATQGGRERTAAEYGPCLAPQGSPAGRRAACGTVRSATAWSAGRIEWPGRRSIDATGWSYAVHAET
jgi:hypothetical protein